MKSCQTLNQKLGKKRRFYLVVQLPSLHPRNCQMKKSNKYSQGNFSSSCMIVSLNLSTPDFGASVPVGPVPVAVPPRPVPSGLGAAGVVSPAAEARASEGSGAEGEGGALFTRLIRGSMANAGISGIYLLS